MPTLNQLSSQVTDALNRPFDTLLLERTKDLIIQNRILFLHRAFEKYGVDRQYVQPYITTLIKVDKSIDDTIPTGLTYLRSTDIIPNVIRMSTETVPFNFVGSIDHSVSFHYSGNYMMPFHKYLKYNGSNIRYDFINGYLYILNNNKLTECLIEALFEIVDIKLVNATSNFARDAMQFPLYGDMLNDVINTTIQMLRGGNDLKEEEKTTHRDVN